MPTRVRQHSGGVLPEGLVTMRSQPHARVMVVGVAGTEADEGALRFAVEEAGRRRCRRVRLVHVVHETVPMSPMLPLFSSETLHEAGYRVVTSAVRRLEELAEHRLLVDAVVEHGQARRMLLQKAEDAHVILLGRRTGWSIERILEGSTAMGVAARARSPVISVPSDWVRTPAGPVVVGVDDSVPSHAALAAAFDEARARRTSVTVVHSWMLPDFYVDIVVARVAEDKLREQAARTLSRMVAPLQGSHPGLPVNFELRHEPAVASLLELSAGASLLVLGRHGHGVSSGLALGSVPRALLRRSRCPVEIVPPQYAKVAMPKTTHAALKGATSAPPLR